MATSNEKLQNVCEQLKKGVVPPPETVRAFLLWFNAERRGFRVVRRIRHRLQQHGLTTEPDFESAYIDALITFKAAPSQAEGKGGKVGDIMAVPDPTYRVGRLEAANRPPVSVKPDNTLQQITTLMLTHDYSQLPVMTGEREVKGIVSWKSIGSRLALKRSCSAARDFMETPTIISSDESLFDAIAAIAEHDFVLVKGNDQKITGIITASDINDQFKILAEPFLLVGEIENGIRRMLHGKFSAAELKSIKDPGDAEREVGELADLTLGEYIRLIEDPKNWKKIGLEVDRAEFVKRLSRVRDIRNEVMHFDPDGLEEDDLTALRDFAEFLQRLRDVGAM